MTILIKNVLLVDGSGRPPVKSDVLVRGEKIAAIGNFPQYSRADEVIDGLGTAYLSPGFIDINTNADLYLNLFSDPLQENFLLQGVTTIIGGQNGISLAPILYGSLELQKFFSNPLKINVNWHSLADFLNVLSRRSLGVNFGMLVGHSTVRQEITGDDFRDLTLKELDVLKFVIDKSLQEGALGVSFDLNFPVANLSPYKEIRALLEVVEKYKSLASVKLRNVSDVIVSLKNGEENFIAAVNEILNLSKETGAKMQLNNFSCLKGLEKEYEESLNLIADNSASADIYFNLHPFDTSIIPLFSFLPSWAKRGSFKEMGEILESKGSRAKIKKDFPEFKPENVFIFQIVGHDYLIGKSLKEFSHERELNSKEGLLELMRLAKLRGNVVYKNLSLKVMAGALNSDRSIIASSFGGFSKGRPSLRLIEFQNTFKRILELSLKGGVLPIEAAVKKMSALPAQRLGLKNKGVIKEGYSADLVVFRESEIDAVIVNGKIAVKNGELTNVKNGKVLRRADK